MDSVFCFARSTAGCDDQEADANAARSPHGRSYSRSRLAPAPRAQQRPCPRVPPPLTQEQVNEEYRKRGLPIPVTDEQMNDPVWRANRIKEVKIERYRSSIEEAGLVPGADDLFRPCAIVHDIWSLTQSAQVILADLFGKNPNVFYELGLAHALKKPVVLVSSNDKDVPFDLQHIRVIYYDVTDPFWGVKLLDKEAENILSAIQNPEEAVFKGDVKIA